MRQPLRPHNAIRPGASGNDDEGHVRKLKNWESSIHGDTPKRAAEVRIRQPSLVCYRVRFDTTH